MKSRIIRFLSTYVLIVVIFVLQRPIFLTYYHSLFEGVTFGEVLAAMWHGLRLDLSLASYLSAIPGLLLVASAWTSAKALRWIGRGYMALVAMIIASAFMVDLCLYEFWGFRLDATPVFYFFTSPSDALASVSPWFAAGGIAAMLVYAAIVWWILDKVFSRPLPAVAIRRRPITSVVALLLTGALFLPIRGSVTPATLNLSVAYFSQNQRLNHAAINPLFSFMYSALHQDNFDRQFRYMDAKEADRLFASLTNRPVENSDSVPRLFATERPNVIIVILESFSNHLMPSLGGENIASNLDRFAKEGVVFTNFFANSFRTDRGLASIISGYPAQPNTSIMKFSEKVENLPSLSRTMSRHGYDLAYYYGGDANFTNMRSYLVSAGFGRIISDKDFPLSERTGKWGAHDHLVFNRLLADLRKETAEKPMLRIIQTSSSHEPHEVPFKKLDDKVKNAFAYTDNCLAEFVAELKAMPMWQNTVIVFVPDHQGGFPAHVEDPVSRHRIPLIFYGGAVSKRQAIDTFGSQNDLAATLLYQLGMPHEEFVFSKNMLNPASPHFAYFTEPSLFGMVSKDNSLVFNCDANTVVVDEGNNPGQNLNPGKAFLQKLYDDLSKR